MALSVAAKGKIEIEQVATLARLMIEPEAG
jgi:hypothetical protein